MWSVTNITNKTYWYIKDECRHLLVKSKMKAMRQLLLAVMLSLLVTLTKGAEDESTMSTTTKKESDEKNKSPMSTLTENQLESLKTFESNCENNKGIFIPIWSCFMSPDAGKTLTDDTDKQSDPKKYKAPYTDPRIGLCRFKMVEGLDMTRNQFREKEPEQFLAVETEMRNLCQGWKGKFVEEEEWRLVIHNVQYHHRRNLATLNSVKMFDCLYNPVDWLPCKQKAEECCKDFMEFEKARMCDRRKKQCGPHSNALYLGPRY